VAAVAEEYLPELVYNAEGVVTENRCRSALHAGPTAMIRSVKAFERNKCQYRPLARTLNLQSGHNRPRVRRGG
jgi:hypothetical protein